MTYKITASLIEEIIEDHMSTMSESVKNELGPSLIESCLFLGIKIEELQAKYRRDLRAALNPLVGREVPNSVFTYEEAETVGERDISNR